MITEKQRKLAQSAVNNPDFRFNNLYDLLHWRPWIEEAARKVLQGLEPGLYNIPHLKSMEDMKKPENIKKFEDGPAGFLTVLPKGVPSMGKNMGISFLFNIVVGIVIAYLASRKFLASFIYNFQCHARNRFADGTHSIFKLIGSKVCQPG